MRSHRWTCLSIRSQTLRTSLRQSRLSCPILRHDFYLCPHSIFPNCQRLPLLSLRTDVHTFILRRLPLLISVEVFLHLTFISRQIWKCHMKWCHTLLNAARITHKRTARTDNAHIWPAYNTYPSTPYGTSIRNLKYGSRITQNEST